MESPSAWVITVDMGYGHQRAAYPLIDIAYERIITANSDKMISYEERKIWENTRSFYEFISRLKEFPLFGKKLFEVYDNFLYISPFFPFRDLSVPDFNAITLKKQILKKGLCKSLLNYVAKKDIPFIATHPIPAIAAHYHNMKKIYCICTDTDIARAWVIDNPKLNTITYFSPCAHVAVRLREYGIKEEHIIMTGFPLPKENIGENQSILKKDLASRLINLDPNKIFIKEYEKIINEKLGKLKKDHPLTITYAIGGAGALVEVGLQIINSLKEKLRANEMIVNVTTGTRMDVLSFYKTGMQKLGLTDLIGNSVNLLFELDKKSYFASFNKALRKTDILWTKPSELAFYTALGLPIIIAPPIGSHENYNKEWLTNMGAGFVQEDPEYTADWLNYWLQEGRLAKAAWQGFSEAPILGTYKIEEYIRKSLTEPKK